MNLQNIEIEHIKMFIPQDYLIMALIAILLIGIALLMIVKINKLSTLSNNKPIKVLNRIILVLFLSTIIVSAIPQTIENRTKDHYRVIIKNEETIEKIIEINKDQYIFLKKMKKKDFLSQKFTKEEINRAKAILIR